MSFQAIAAQLEFLAWRDAQLAATSAQVEDAFASLLDDLTSQIDRAGILDLARSSVTLKSSADGVMQRWFAEQLDAARHRAEAELDYALMQMPGGVDLNGGLWEQGAKFVPAIAGVGLIAASVAAIPTVISFATVSTSVLAFWGTASISWPLFAVGAAAIGLAALTGSQSLKLAEESARTKLRERLHREAARWVFGIGNKPGTRCMLSDIQAAVIKAGENRIRGENT